MGKPDVATYDEGMTDEKLSNPQTYQQQISRASARTRATLMGTAAEKWRSHTIDDPEGQEYEVAPQHHADALNKRFERGAGPVVWHPTKPNTLVHSPNNFWDGPTHVTPNEDGTYSTSTIFGPETFDSEGKTLSGGSKDYYARQDEELRRKYPDAFTSAKTAAPFGGVPPTDEKMPGASAPYEGGTDANQSTTKPRQMPSGGGGGIPDGSAAGTFDPASMGMDQPSNPSTDSPTKAVAAILRANPSLSLPEARVLASRVVALIDPTQFGSGIEPHDGPMTNFVKEKASEVADNATKMIQTKIPGGPGMPKGPGGAGAAGEAAGAGEAAAGAGAAAAGAGEAAAAGGGAAAAAELLPLLLL
jgi:hypothetical protein